MPDQTTDEEQAQVRPFAAFLQEQSAGRTHEELSAKLHDLIVAVQETGKGGSLTLKIDVKPIPGAGKRTLTVTDAVAVKIPKTDRPKSIFFITDDGNLSRNDPTQPVITGLREVDTTTTQQLRSAQ